MKLLLLGAGGFIGSNLVEHLGAAGEHQLVGIDKSAEKLAGIAPANFRFVEADVAESHDAVEREIAAADVVVDLMAYANPSIYVETPLDVVRLNYDLNIAIVDACVRHGARLIQYSTSEVYGKPNGPTYREDESDLCLGPVEKQRWIYAAAKQLLERVIHAHGLAGDLDYTIVRPFNFIGPRVDYLVGPGTRGGPRVFAHFMSALLTGGPIQLVGGGEQRRSFTHIEDANTAFDAMLRHPDANRRVFNVGNPGNDTSIRGLAELMSRLYRDLTGEQPTSEVVEIGGEEFYGAGYEDSSRVPPDISRLRSLGWEPVHDLEATLRDAMEATLGSAEAAELVSDHRPG